MDTYGEAIAMAAADTIGQVIYVKTKSTYNDSEYESAPYIVIAAGSLQKLAASTAGGNIANDLAAVTTRIGTAEGEIDALQTAVGDATKGLVADVAGIKNTIGDVASGLVKDVADNAAEIESLKGAVAGGVHFIGITSQLPWEGLQETTVGTSLDGGSDYTYGVGDIIIVSPGGNEEYVEEPTAEYILVEGNETGPDDSDGGTIKGYRWVALGDVTAEGQRISALESLIDSDKVSTWNTAASQASTLTANIGNYALKTEVASDYVAKETGKSLVSDTLITKLDGLANIKSVDANSVLSVTADGALTANLSDYVAKDGNKVLSTNDFTNDLKTKLDNIAPYAQVNVIEEIKLNNKALTPSNKSVNIDLGEYAKDADKVDKTTTINDQPLSTNVILDAQDIKTVTTIGADNAGATVETVLTSLNTKIGTVSTVANSALQEVFGSSTIAVTNKNTVSVKVKPNSAIKATADGLDLE